jgi:uncharacterized membrane protein
MAQFCSSCGAQMPDGAMVCPACGKGSAATATAVAAPAGTTGGLADNVAGLLAYLFIPAIIFLVIEPYNKNRFIRFHSFQDIFFVIGCIVINIGLIFVNAIPFLGFIIALLVGLGLFIVWLVLMLKAFQGQMFKLPVIGDMAEKQANAI